MVQFNRGAQIAGNLMQSQQPIVNQGLDMVNLLNSYKDGATWKQERDAAERQRQSELTKQGFMNEFNQATDTGDEQGALRAASKLNPVKWVELSQTLKNQQAQREYGRETELLKHNLGLAEKRGSAQFDNEAKLRGEVENLSKDFRKAKDQYDVFKSTINSASPAGDMGSIFAFMKILDPNSVVRESEYSAAAKANGLSDRGANYIDLVMTGQKLTPDQRKDFETQVDSMMAMRSNSFKGTQQHYVDLSDKYGLNPDNVIDKKLIPTQSQQVQGGKAF